MNKLNLDIVTSLGELAGYDHRQDLLRPEADRLGQELDLIRRGLGLNRSQELFIIDEKTRLLREGGYQVLTGPERLLALASLVAQVLDGDLGGGLEQDYRGLEARRTISLDFLGERRVSLESLVLREADSPRTDRSYEEGVLARLKELLGDLESWKLGEGYVQLEFSLDRLLAYGLDCLDLKDGLDLAGGLELLAGQLNLMLMNRYSSARNNSYGSRELFALYDGCLRILLEGNGEFLGGLEAYGQEILEALRSYLAGGRRLLDQDMDSLLGLLDSFHGLDYSSLILKSGQAELLLRASLNPRGLDSLKLMEAYNFNHSQAFEPILDGQKLNQIKLFI